MTSRRSTAHDPPAPHFTAETRAGTAGDGEPDYLESAKLYRRKIVDVQPAAGEATHIGSRWFVGARGAFLAGYNDGVVTTARTAEDIAGDGVDGVIVNLALSGRFRVIADGRDETFVAGDLFIEDTARPRKAISEFSSGGTVFIPRERFRAAIGAPTEHLTLVRLARAPLAPTVSQQIRFLHQNLGALAPDEYEAALDAAIEVALVMLRKEAGRDRPPEDAHLIAAKAFIEAHFRNVELTPADMASAVGCSRAVLYRSFANAGLTVAGYLRDVRFRHFLDGLRSQPEAPIYNLAYDNGFEAKASDFTKLFKRAYGMTPREARVKLTA
jgi:AraC-like DNA-binding protein